MRKNLRHLRNLWDLNIINEKNLRHLRNLRDKLIFSEKKKTAEKKKIRGKKKQESLRNLSKSEALH